MKKIIIAAAAATLFSTMATANSGLADRINEARTYPNKTASTESTQMHGMKNKQSDRHMGKHQVIRGELRHLNYEAKDSDAHSMGHTHS